MYNEIVNNGNIVYLLEAETIISVNSSNSSLVGLKQWNTCENLLIPKPSTRYSSLIGMFLQIFGVITKSIFYQNPHAYKINIFWNNCIKTNVITIKMNQFVHCCSLYWICWSGFVFNKVSVHNLSKFCPKIHRKEMQKEIGISPIIVSSDNCWMNGLLQ